MISSSDSKLPGNHLNSMINSTMYRNLLPVAFIRRISHHKSLSRLNTEPPCTGKETAQTERILLSIFHMRIHIHTLKSYNYLGQYNKQYHRKVKLNCFKWQHFRSLTTHRLRSQNHLIQHNEQHHRNLLLISFVLNGHALGFRPQTQKLERFCTV